ncbi:MAG: hypothetical protein J6M39_02365 [Lachnospiraceae bacterium]|nr:hypothetical protein [Lachnospiraceae bacterium]
MMYSFNFKINEKDIFNSTMNYNKSRITYLFDIIFTLAAFIIIIYNLLNKTFSNFNIYYRLLLIFCALLFPVIQPILLYIKSLAHAKKLKDINILMEFNEDSIKLSTNSENTEVLYENVYNFIKYKNMIVVMYDSIHGQIMPERIFIKDGKSIKNEFYEYVASKIRNAREKQKEKNK